MNFVELYEKFGIVPAEFRPNESNEEFGRRYLSSYSVVTEQKGVVYSTGSVVNTNNLASKPKNDYQLYSY
ncbi:hypothetical protein [Erwinia aphidicola]|uniref:hypothetical protein n=1 Tax=Erwinia aphidicola TaxID=68334 RepID=UPI00209F0A02|nr:hypothetical protein [Erwinia aphidicola]MCP2232861.1 hypothetical protein [Erwinia aphidicola]